MPLVPTFDIAELVALPDHPVILRNHRPALKCEMLRELLAAVGFPRLSGYRDGRVYDYADMEAAEVLAAFTAGRLRLGIASSYVTPEADPDDALTVPPLVDDGNLFNLHKESCGFRKSLVITQSGGYSRMHVDSYGMAGWMYLFRGRKVWNLWEHSFAPLFYNLTDEWYFDDAVGDAHPDARCRALLDSLPRWDGEIGPGEMLWFPEGWLHRVWTLEDAFGYGGSSLHAARLEQAVGSWLWERRLGFSRDFDYPGLLQDAAAHGFDTERHIKMIDDTITIWRKNGA